MSTDEVDPAETGTTEADPDARARIADLRRVLTRMAWRDRPTLTLTYDRASDTLTVIAVPLPTARRRYVHGTVTVGLDGDTDPMPTGITLAGLLGTPQNGPTAHLAHQLIGARAWLAAIQLPHLAVDHSEIELTSRERDQLVETWSEFARPVRAVGIQVLPGMLRAVVVDELGTTLDSAELTLERTTPDTVADGCRALATDLLAPHPGTRNGVGVSIGGPVDPEGVVAQLNKHDVEAPEWRGAPLQAQLASRLFAPVTVLNDAAALAVYECWFGFGRARSTYAVTLVGEGIGGALVRNGSLDHEAPMEIGNIVIDTNGPKCRCGSFGCVEAMAGEWAIIEAVARAAQLPVRTLAEAVEIAEHGGTGCPRDREHLTGVTRQIFRNAGESLAFGMASVQGIEKPEGYAVYLPPALSGTAAAARAFWSGVETTNLKVSYPPHRISDLVCRETTPEVGPVSAALSVAEASGLAGPPPR